MNYDITSLLTNGMIGAFFVLAVSFSFSFLRQINRDARDVSNSTSRAYPAQLFLPDSSSIEKQIVFSVGDENHVTEYVEQIHRTMWSIGVSFWWFGQKDLENWAHTQTLLKLYSHNTFSVSIPVSEIDKWVDRLTEWCSFAQQSYRRYRLLVTFIGTAEDASAMMNDPRVNQLYDSLLFIDDGGEKIITNQLHGENV